MGHCPQVRHQLLGLGGECLTRNSLAVKIHPLVHGDCKNGPWFGPANDGLELQSLPACHGSRAQVMMNTGRVGLGMHFLQRSISSAGPCLAPVLASIVARICFVLATLSLF